MWYVPLAAWYIDAHQRPSLNHILLSGFSPVAAPPVPAVDGPGMPTSPSAADACTGAVMTTPRATSSPISCRRHDRCLGLPGGSSMRATRRRYRSVSGATIPRGSISDTHGASASCRSGQRSTRAVKDLHTDLRGPPYRADGEVGHS